jgi:fructose-1,6-bisphosphatase-3
MALAEHKPYSPLQPDGTQEFFSPVVKIVETLPERMMVMDTDQGVEIVQAIDDMKQLVDAYRRGIIKEKY